MAPSLLSLAARLSLAVSLTLAAGSVMGCRGPQPKSPDGGLAEVNPPTNPDLGRYPARVSVDVLNLYMADSVRNVCAGSLPFFEYDSSKVEAEDKGSMNNLAQCMKHGALQGKTIVLTGRTDPRGSEEYNEQLGLDRADKVRQFLIRRGVEGQRVKIASLGKADASPFPKDWPSDRRVQIDLAQ